ncbi:MAG TPA: hypothetical protein ENK02_05280 [Planctomycetes bacterium]|nr:hypothetical protein [Planctomycetota bacterium]
MNRQESKMFGRWSMLGVLVFSVGTLPAQRPMRRGAPAPKEELVIYKSPSEVGQDLGWRSIGPSNHSGRILDIAVDPRNPQRWFIASATGGVWKTENRGLNFVQVFQSRTAFSIGAIAMDPSDSNTIWVGTGEGNNQRSSYWGDGVYKSTDGGKTWKNMGLPRSHYIGRIVVDPSDGNRVFVAVLGALYSPNPERGLYRTTDGGKTWRLVLKISEDVGVVDVAMMPGKPQVMLACSYERRRRAWNFDGAGPGSGVWRSTDGGTSWKRIRAGLPKGEIGRIGVAFSTSQPKIAYLTLSNQNKAKKKAVRRFIDPEGDAETEEGEEGRPEGLELPPQAVQGRQPLVGGEVYRSEDAGKTWKKVSRKAVGGTPAYYYGQIRVHPMDAQKVYVLSVPLYYSSNGGKTFKNIARGIHVDHHALWIDPKAEGHLLLGNDGGLHETWDHGRTWLHFQNLPVGQYYAVTADLARPYRVYGGTQDNGTWGVPSQGPTTKGIRLIDCFKVSGGDGFQVQVDPEDPNIVYTEYQFGNLMRTDLRKMRPRGIKPRPKKGEAPYRFNWMSPVKLSAHNHSTLYFGGNKLFKSLDRGNSWKAISDDLTTQDAAKIAGNVPHCTLTAIGESPLRQGLLMVGTDDGKLWLTPDDGVTWKDLSDALPREAHGLWVSSIDPSHHQEGRFYVSVTGYREDDFLPRVYVTEDYGLSFRKITGNLPKEGPVNVIREDRVNPDLLFVGTEFGAFFSPTAGGTWLPLGKGLPCVAVHDLYVHPRSGDLIAGTHGRGMFILDIRPLQAWKRGKGTDKPRLVLPKELYALPRGPQGGYTELPRNYVSPNPVGTHLAAILPRASKAELRLVDVMGKVLRSFSLPKEAGMMRLQWNLGIQPSGTNANRRGFFGRMAGRFMRGIRRGRLGKGRYSLQLFVDGKRVDSKALELQ